MSEKARLYKHLNLTFVSPSHWLANQARNSPISRSKLIRIIPNPVPTHIFRPLDKLSARRSLGLDPQAKVVLSGAFGSDTDPNKGGDLLHSALACIRSTYPDLIHIEFGCRRPVSLTSTKLSFGQIQDQNELRILYAAADVFLLPSRIENAPIVAIEALLSGTPVVAFRVGGLSEIVTHSSTGLLASPFSVESLAHCLLKDLEEPFAFASRVLDANSSLVELYSYPSIAKQYSNLFTELMHA